jgi:transposase
MNTPPTDPLFPPPQDASTDQRIFISPSLWFVECDGYRVVFCRHEPIYRYALHDKPQARFVAVMLRQSELATQEDLALAFGHSVAAQRRWERRYEQDGLAGLDNQAPPGRERKLDRTQEQFVKRWFEQGLSKAEIARRLGVGPTTIDRTCKRLGLHRPATPAPQLPLDQADQPLLPEPTAELSCPPPADFASLPPPPTPVSVPDDASPYLPADAADALLQAATTQAAVPIVEPTAPSTVVSPQQASPDPTTPETAGPQPQPPSMPFTLDLDPSNRACDRFLARQGLLADAAPLFASTSHLPRAGVLLAVPLLVKSGVLAIFASIYESLQPAFYGLRTLVVTLLFMAWLRIKRPENLKEYAPTELGRLLGLDRAPEVKTVRRKLEELAQRKRGQQLLEALARQRLAQQQEALAFFYVDGHVREYHGSEPLAKAKKAQSPVARTAETDFWINDSHGMPLLVVTQPMNAALTQVLQPIVDKVKMLLPAEQRLTVLFDRGGFSAKLFRRLIDSGVDVITYRKGKWRRLPRQCFREHVLELAGQSLSYQLYDQPRVRVGRLRAKRKKRRANETPQFLWLRQVTVLREDGRQTPLLTNRTDLPAVEVVSRLFGRWRQENFFKYMDAEYALDALVEYGTEDVPADADRPNPKRRPFQKRLRQVQAEVLHLQAALGAEADTNAESPRPSMRGFKEANEELRQQLRKAEQKVERLKERLKRLPKRVLANTLKTRKTEKKRIVDGLKMTAYQIETELLGMLREDYARTEDEGRTFLQAAFQSSGRLEVTGEELRVTLAAQSSPHRSQALAALCAKLNALDTCFPGTNLRLRLAVEPLEPLIS